MPFISGNFGLSIDISIGCAEGCGVTSLGESVAQELNRLMPITKGIARISLLDFTGELAAA